MATSEEDSPPTAATDPVSEPAGPPPDPVRWVKRGVALVVLLIGWFFVLWTNRFHLTAPTVFVCLGYLAIVLAVYNLFHTGAEAVAEEADEPDSTWGRPVGARGELEREKKALLKAIKEAEFDREMGKLSKTDADEMIGLYRARAIEVIKELDKLEVGSVGTVREQIEREVKARLEIEARTKKPAHTAAVAATEAKGKKKSKGKAEAKADDKPANGAKTADTKADDTKTTDAKIDEAKTTDANTDAAKADAATTDDAATVAAAAHEPEPVAEREAST